MVELQNEDKLAEIIDKKIGDEIDGSIISDVFDGYKFKITGGFDKDGFAMKNGILAQGKKSFTHKRLFFIQIQKRIS